MQQAATALHGPYVNGNTCLRVQTCNQRGFMSAKPVDPADLWQQGSALQLALDGCLGQDIGHKAGVGQTQQGDGGGGTGLQPLLNSSSLISVPISRNHRVYQCDLRTIQVSHKCQSMLSTSAFCHMGADRFVGQIMCICSASTTAGQCQVAHAR